MAAAGPTGVDSPGSGRETHRLGRQKRARCIGAVPMSSGAYALMASTAMRVEGFTNHRSPTARVGTVSLPPACSLTTAAPAGSSQMFTSGSWMRARRSPLRSAMQ